ncbi:MAG: hypothetical protein JRJ84_25785 [Deltaproteobacteria bacterium]|nr:hypothetical protein [Deltaproteobacteria bacterium]
MKEIFSKFKRVMTVEINYSDELGDPLIDEESRRLSQLAYMLRAHTLVNVDCWSRIPGSPLPPGMVADAIRTKLKRGE